MSSPEVQQLTQSIHSKLDQLQRAMDGLPERFASVVQEQPRPKKPPTYGDKDILNDDEPNSVFHRGMSPEAQIQRLTAQLTAAYNRIAALEEQLLTKRNLV